MGGAIEFRNSEITTTSGITTAYTPASDSSVSEAPFRYRPLSHDHSGNTSCGHRLPSLVLVRHYLVGNLENSCYSTTIALRSRAMFKESLVPPPLWVRQPHHIIKSQKTPPPSSPHHCVPSSPPPPSLITTATTNPKEAIPQSRKPEMKRRKEDEP